MFVQKFKFNLMKMQQKLLPPVQSLSFWLRYVPNRLSAGASPRPQWGRLQRSPDLLDGLGGGTPGEREGGEGKGGERVPECPNPELASLV